MPAPPLMKSPSSILRPHWSYCAPIPARKNSARFKNVLSFTSILKCVSLKFCIWKLCRVGIICIANGLSHGHPYQWISRCQWPFHICSKYYCPFAYGHIVSMELLWRGLWRTCRVTGVGLPKREAKYKLSIPVATVCRYVTTILIHAATLDVINNSWFFLAFCPNNLS